MSGFKSFANRTQLDFMPSFARTSESKLSASVEREKRPLGITAIVGPNGSGKSNVADAIRWAIGEQSLKNLRGKKSEDVIFAGTDQKTRLGSASVTLYFDNSDKRIPIEFSEVAITRKIFRSGESEYLINGSRVRLMDVVDMLARAGIGKDSYCVITQGMPDEILNATPSDRRAIFEDAAGVKPFQLQKDRAIRKLASTDENLNRVEALAREIEPHLKNLRRQAEKAAQKQEIAQKLENKQKLLYGYLWHTFQNERAGLAGERDALQAKIFDLEVATKNLEREVNEISRGLGEGRAEETLLQALPGLRQEMNAAQRELNLVEARVTFEKERQKEKETVTTNPVDLRYVKESLGDIETDQEKLIERLRSAEKMEDLEGIRVLAQVIRQKIHELSVKASAGRVERKYVRGLSAEEQAKSDAVYQTLLAEKTALEKAVGELDKALSEKEAALSAVREENRSNRETFFSKEKNWREKESELTKLKDALNEVKVRLARVEVREEDLTALVREELSAGVETLTHDGTPVEREKLDREIMRLKTEVEHIGSLDPLVVEEYQETEKRYQFLSRESADLRQAAHSLGDVIKEMDQKIEAVFHTAFKEIQGKFVHYFKLIFGGGRAELKLTRLAPRRAQDSDEETGESDQPEEQHQGEIGIEISACPPGKKITHLSMLSGGERALTSLALLFAIIAHNPPPFAVLDEVEAALDEANSRRFGKILRELSEHTQFIAITHNRETMAQASLLYGVTMGPDGVSQLLSIRLDEVEEEG